MKPLLRWLTGRKTSPKPSTTFSAHELTLLDAEQNDIIELYLPDDTPDADPYLMVTKVEQCKGGGNLWVDILAEGPNRAIWLEYSEPDGRPFLTVSNADDNPVAPEHIGITQDDLTTLDEEQSTNNALIIGASHYNYLNSYECKRTDQTTGQSHMAWVWDLISQDGNVAISICKRKDAPYEAFVTQVINPDCAQLRKAK